MKSGIMQTGLSHPARLETGWDMFTGERLTIDEVSHLRAEGWEPWISHHGLDREVWIRRTPPPVVAEIPEMAVEEGGPDD